MSQERSGSTSRTQSDSSSPQDDWANVSDPNERRKIQNRIAQRKFREKARQYRQFEKLRGESESNAGSAYTSPDPNELDVGAVSGPPWGSISLKYIIQTGRQRAQKVPIQSANTSVPGAGGTTRPGLHLIDSYARGVPAWAAWRVPRGFIQASSSIDTDTGMMSDR